MTRYRREGLLLVLVGLTALAFAYGYGWPDISRLGLTQAIALDGTLRIDRYAEQTNDRAPYHGHNYSDKAPAISFVALPTFEAMRALHVVDANDEQRGLWHDRGLLFAVRLFTGGLAFLGCVVLVGRASESLRPGTGLLAAATFGLGTMALPLAATTFGHIAAGTLAFAAFIAVRRQAVLVAGACAGAAVLFEYQAAIAAAVVALFAVARWRSARPLGLFALGAAIPLALLATYNTAAFGAPQHFSYRYVGGGCQTGHGGFFGIGVPSADGIAKTLFGNRGLLVFSPVLVLAAAGLALLWRRGRRGEAAACVAVTALFLVLDSGYCDPYGGLSPGPRYAAPMLPFLVFGLPEAFGRWPRLTGVAAVASVGGMLYQAGTYGPNFNFSTVWWWLGLPRALGLVLVLIPCCAAIALAAQSWRRAKAMSVSEVEG